MIGDLDVAIEKVVQAKMEKLDSFLIEQLKELDLPIEGKITKEKLKARDIRLNSQPIGNQKSYWLTENGKQIGEKITL